jgi:hypothetical protein
MAATSARLGLRATGTDALAAMQEMLDRSVADVRAAAIMLSTYDPEGWAQRDMTGKFQRPSVYLEIYWRSLKIAADISTSFVGLGIAAMSADVVRRDAEQVTTLLQAFAHALGHRWDAPETQTALVDAIGRLEVA